MIRCVLDEDGCIDLLAVMRIMNQVDQEQVWAIAYELAALMQRLWPAGNCALIESLAQIFIHRDGSIQEKSLLTLPQNVESIHQDANKQHQATPTTTNSTTINIKNEDSSIDRKTNKMLQQQLPPSPPITPELSELVRRRPALNEFELVSSLGKALFWALDYGIPDDEERKLSMTMEYLIFKSQSELTLNEILEICIKRLPIATKTNADLHYREVCKSLIGDTIELSVFLDKIYTATMELSGLNNSTRRRTNATTNTTTNTTATDLVDDYCLVAAAAAAKRRHKSLSDSDSKDNCDKILNNHHHLHYHQLDHVDHELGLPLASLRALKIDEWARLWMQVIKEMRQRSKFKHLGIATSGQDLDCSNL